MGTLAFDDLSGLGRTGTGTLKVDGKEVQTIKMPKTLPMILQWDESFDIGSDLDGREQHRLSAAVRGFTATLEKLTIKVNQPCSRRKTSSSWNSHRPRRLTARVSCCASCLALQGILDVLPELQADQPEYGGGDRLVFAVAAPLVGIHWPVRTASVPQDQARRGGGVLLPNGAVLHERMPSSCLIVLKNNSAKGPTINQTRRPWPIKMQKPISISIDPMYSGLRTIE